MIVADNVRSPAEVAGLAGRLVQQVKLDRGFIGELGASAYHQAVVTAALQVARALGLEVVAEGVETQAQAQALTALGWLYAKALDAEAAHAWLLQPQPASSAHGVHG